MTPVRILAAVTLVAAIAGPAAGVAFKTSVAAPVQVSGGSTPALQTTGSDPTDFALFAEEKYVPVRKAAMKARAALVAGQGFVALADHSGALAKIDHLLKSELMGLERRSSTRDFIDSALANAQAQEDLDVGLTEFNLRAAVGTPNAAMPSDAQAKIDSAWRELDARIEAALTRYGLTWDQIGGRP